MNATIHIFFIVIATYVMLLSDSSLEGISIFLLLYSSHAEPEEHFVHTSGVVVIDPDLDPWFTFQDKSDI